MHTRQSDSPARYKRYSLKWWLVLLSLLLAACAGTGKDGTSETGPFETSATVERAQAKPELQQGHEQVRKAATTMLEGIKLYDDGDFRGAIAILDTAEIRNAPTAIRVEALKYTAFSYCVTESYTPCRYAFDLALQLDPDFELLANERSHPMWGPIFSQAKAARDRNRVHTTTAGDRERWRGIEPWRPK